VAHHRNDAALTPCQLRSALLEPVTPGVAHLADVITAIELVGGLVDVGGGLYQCGHPAGPDQRWFVSTLSADTIRTIAREGPSGIDHSDISVRVAADLDVRRVRRLPQQVSAGSASTPRRAGCTASAWSSCCSRCREPPAFSVAFSVSLSHRLCPNEKPMKRSLSCSPVSAGRHRRLRER
jgi:hypothetical protein